MKHILPVLAKYMPAEGGSFADLFTGGGSVALAVAEEYPTARIVVNDLNPGIAGFWRCIAAGRAEEIAVLVEEVVPSVDRFAWELLAAVEDPGYPDDDPRIAFRTLLLNRLAYAASTGRRPKGGWGGDEDFRALSVVTPEAALAGIAACDRPILQRWYPERTAQQVRVLGALAGRLEVWQRKAWEVPGGWDCLYLDPPYVKEGPGLYELSMTAAEHEALAQWLHTRDRWVLSYDNHATVRQLYADAQITELRASYSVGTVRSGTELLIVSGSSGPG